MTNGNCIFCKIIKGEIPCYKVCEDDNFLAFLDINPVTPGHTLLIPKSHCEMMLDASNEMTAKIFVLAKKIMKKIKKAMEADFVVLSVVGIDIPHFHIHLIPRKHNDGLENFWPTKKYKDEELKNVLEKLKNLL